MQALLNLASVNNTLSSLQSLYDTIEGHVRGLASLGKHPESYGTMLTPVILSKLPKEIRKNIARDHNNIEWPLDDLTGALLKEILLETGIHTSGPSNHTSYDSQPMTMASLHTGAMSNPQQPSERKPTHCVHFKQFHLPSRCDVVTNPQDHMAIVKKDKLCFNCLGRHKLSKCMSRFKCKVCKHKHHTSLCTSHTNTKSDDKGTGQMSTTTELFTLLHQFLSQLLCKAALAY